MNKFELPLVDVMETPEAIELVFLDEVARETHSVKWNKKRFNPDTKTWDDDPEKMQEIAQWSEQYLNVPFEDIESAVGNAFTVYSYPSFDSMWEVASKFPTAMKGQFIQGEIDRVEKTPVAIEIWFRYEGDLYVSRMRHDRRVGDNIYTDGTKRNRRYAEFQDKYGVSVDEAAEGALSGRVVNVLIKTFGKNAFPDIQSIVQAK